MFLGKMGFTRRDPLVMAHTLTRELFGGENVDAYAVLIGKGLEMEVL